MSLLVLLVVVAAELVRAVVEVVLNEEQVAVALGEVGHAEVQGSDPGDKAAPDEGGLEVVPALKDGSAVNEDGGELLAGTEVLSGAVPLLGLSEFGCLLVGLLCHVAMKEKNNQTRVWWSERK